VILLKVAYLGWAFHGSQIQPHCRTVEGDLVPALKKLGCLRERHGFASRTDAGVSALANVFAYTGQPPDLKRLNHLLRDMVVWAHAEVPDSFRVRGAVSRSYRYHLVGDYARARVQALKKFQGTHDFALHTRAHKDTVRTLDSITIHKQPYGWTLDFTAAGFLWNQIRRLVGTLDPVGRTAPPEPLLLTEVRFDPEPVWVRQPDALQSFTALWQTHLTRTQVLGVLASELE